MHPIPRPPELAGQEGHAPKCRTGSSAASCDRRVLDCVEADLADVLQDPEPAQLVSHEGALAQELVV